MTWYSAYFPYSFILCTKVSYLCKYSIFLNVSTHMSKTVCLKIDYKNDIMIA